MPVKNAVHRTDTEIVRLEFRKGTLHSGIADAKKSIEIIKQRNAELEKKTGQPGVDRLLQTNKELLAEIEGRVKADEQRVGQFDKEIMALKKRLKQR